MPAPSRCTSPLRTRSSEPTNQSVAVGFTPKSKSTARGKRKAASSPPPSQTKHQPSSPPKNDTEQPSDASDEDEVAPERKNQSRLNKKRHSIPPTGVQGTLQFEDETHQTRYNAF
ncbi:hypothetical protein P3X46_012493 [Hevea brasiliensis]|uniref:Uncharacterized protein n=1 Tax=Hevea brasiliensis TaxID=3981 RepID=A0ABQ9MAD6_HEVBR|nr:hypothetical protein P3X46_012493 [Hevea brasiliensis]